MAHGPLIIKFRDLTGKVGLAVSLKYLLLLLLLFYLKPNKV